MVAKDVAAKVDDELCRIEARGQRSRRRARRQDSSKLHKGQHRLPDFSEADLGDGGARQVLREGSAVVRIVPRPRRAATVVVLEHPAEAFNVRARDCLPLRLLELREVRRIVSGSIAWLAQGNEVLCFRRELTRCR
eukprot:1275546-Prymnesium_polylepis.1